MVTRKEFVTQFIEDSKRFRCTFTPVEKANLYISDLKPSMVEEMLKKLRLMHPNMSSNHIAGRPIAAAKGRSQPTRM